MLDPGLKPKEFHHVLDTILETYGETVYAEDPKNDPPELKDLCEQWGKRFRMPPSNFRLLLRERYKIIRSEEMSKRKGLPKPEAKQEDEVIEAGVGPNGLVVDVDNGKLYTGQEYKDAMARKGKKVKLKEPVTTETEGVKPMSNKGNKTSVTLKKYASLKDEAPVTKKRVRQDAAPDSDKMQRGKPRRYKDHMTINVLSKENPKREGTEAFKAYKLYKDGMTIKAFIKAGGRMDHIIYDTKKGYISVNED